MFIRIKIRPGQEIDRVFLCSIRNEHGLSRINPNFKKQRIPGELGKEPFRQKTRGTDREAKN